MSFFDRWRPPRLLAFFHEAYAINQPAPSRTTLFDPLRPMRIQQDLARSPRAALVAWRQPEIAPEEDLLRVHPAGYLDEARRPHFLAEVFAMHRIDPWDTELWDAIRLAVGGTVQAAREALRTGIPAANLAGGFHHAAPHQAAGFCVLNDTAVAVAALRAEGLTEPVAVIDLDYHQGDGNEECLAGDRATWILSLQAAWWRDTGKAELISRTVPADIADDAYLGALEVELQTLARKVRPKIVFYIAGVDPWIGDAMCDMQLSSRAMLARDRMVAAWARGQGAALVILPAGGYGAEAWRPTARFLRAVIEEGA